MGIIPETDIDFKEDNERFYIVKTTKPKSSSKFKKVRGIASVKMTTDEILNLTRDITKFTTYFPQVKLIHPNSA